MVVTKQNHFVSDEKNLGLLWRISAPKSEPSSRISTAFSP